MPQAAAPTAAARRLQTVRAFGRWDCITAHQRERAKASRFAASTSLFTSPAIRDGRQSAGLFAYSPGCTAEIDSLLEESGFELMVPPRTERKWEGAGTPTSIILGEHLTLRFRSAS
jgi:hypothetical protein